MWNRIGPYFIIFLGVMFLLDNFGLPFFDIGDLVQLWPLILIWVGWDMLRSRGKVQRRNPD